MVYFWYVVTTLLGAWGALGVLRAVERLIFGGGSGSIALQFGIGLGFLFLASKARSKAIDARQSQKSKPSIPQAR